MIHTEEQLKPVVTGFTCDCCAKTVDVESLDHQEAVHLDLTGGYTSVFGDGAQVQCDLCQDCVKALLGKHVRVTPSPY